MQKISQKNNNKYVVCTQSVSQEILMIGEISPNLGKYQKSGDLGKNIIYIPELNSPEPVHNIGPVGFRDNYTS